MTRGLKPPLPGRVDSVQVRLGSRVKVGDRLFSVRSGAYAELDHELEAARAQVNAIANPTNPEVGEQFLGTVVKLATFGAFVSLLPGKDGLLHISQIAHQRVEKVTDFLKEGQIVKVKVLEVDLARNRISLTMKLDAAVPKSGGAGRGDNNFRPAARNERFSAPRGQQPAAQGGGQSAMAAAFAKLQTKR